MTTGTIVIIIIIIIIITIIVIIICIFNEQTESFLHTLLVFVIGSFLCLSL